MSAPGRASVVDTLPGARRALTGVVSLRLDMLWRGLGSWRDEDAERFVVDAVSVVRAGQRQLATLVAASTARRASAATGTAVPALGLTDDEAVNLRQGVDDVAVYRRPFVTLYTALSRGKPFPEALARGGVRLGEIAEVDLQLTYAQAHRAALTRLPEGVRPPAWRRVLGKGEDECRQCVVAAHGRYPLEFSSPIHPGCHCEIVPDYGDSPGVTTAAERDELRRSIRIHGEVGPMLVRAGDHFDGPRQIA